MTPGEPQQLRQESTQKTTLVVVAMATKRCHMLVYMYQVQFEGFRLTTIKSDCRIKRLVSDV